MNITQDPIYFLSDSSDLVKHIAFELKDERWLKKHPEGTPDGIDESLQAVVHHSHGVFSRDVSQINWHLDRQKGKQPQAYYGTFLDLLFAVHANCVTYGVGYYAAFATKISGTDCKLLFQDEEWGDTGFHKKTPVCTDDMMYHKSVA
jgi:hypothetical protein